MSDRTDDLLEQTLAEGAVPAGATAEERAEVERLATDAARIAESRSAVDAEASASMPIARARFERFVTEQQAAATPTPARPHQRRPWFVGWFSGGMRTYAAATTVLAVVVVAALLAPALLNDVETASAQVLVPGEYVEFEAVAGETADGTLSVAADFGDVEVLLDDETHVVDSSGSAPGQLRPDRHVVVAGVVGDDLRVRARTVAISDNEAPRPDRKRPRPLQELRGELIGRVVAVAFGEDGRPRIVLAAGADNLVVVNVQPEALETFLGTAAAPVGVAVRITRLEDGAPGIFGVELVDSDERPTPNSGTSDRPRILTFAGVVTARDGAIVTLQTELRGEIVVRVTPETQFRIGDPSVLGEEVRGERVIGRFVTVQAAPDPRNDGGLIAVTVLVGREVPERTR